MARATPSPTPASLALSRCDSSPPMHETKISQGLKIQAFHSRAVLIPLRPRNMRGTVCSHSGHRPPGVGFWRSPRNKPMFPPTANAIWGFSIILLAGTGRAGPAGPVAHSGLAWSPACAPSLCPQLVPPACGFPSSPACAPSLCPQLLVPRLCPQLVVPSLCPPLVFPACAPSLCPQLVVPRSPPLVPPAGAPSWWSPVVPR